MAEKDETSPVLGVPYEEWGPYKKHIETLTEIATVEKDKHDHELRNHPTLGDIDIYDNGTVTLNAGSKGTISFEIPQGYVFYFPRCGMTFYPNTEYRIYIDGVLAYDTPFDIQGISEHADIFKPPKLVKSSIAFEIINGDTPHTHTYWVYVAGWLRRREKVKE